MLNRFYIKAITNKQHFGAVFEAVFALSAPLLVCAQGSGIRNKKQGFYLHRKEPDARSGEVPLSLRSHTGESRAALQGPHHFASCQNPRHFEESL